MTRTILIIDDNPGERIVLSSFLKATYHILQADSEDTAISLLNSQFQTVSAIILDVAMPGLDGFAVLQRIRQNARFQAIPVIVTTSLADERAHEQAIAYGANGFIAKPYTHALLLHTVENAIKLRETAAMLDTVWRDKLTGLLTREAFFVEAAQLIRRHVPGYYVLSCFDVENFKLINDQYGTDKGDMVLRHIAACIGDFVAAVDGLACRFTADRFAILYPSERMTAEATVKKHTEAMTPACIGRSIRIRIGRYRVGNLALSVSDMFDRATLAQESIKGRYDVYIADYHDGMREKLLEEQRIVNEMEHALHDGQFEPWFQPQYNHATGAMIGAEALVRWRRGGRIIPPDHFIPVFERNGFIYEIDQSLWRQVCKLLRRWLDEGKEPLPISVNISRYDLFQASFLPGLCALVKEYAIPAGLLRLEITESAFAESTKKIINAVNELIANGFTVEIDDFGSGYSSLNTLKDVPASILKLDMRFFENTKNQQRGGNIVESVVRMATWLGMSVIAEGVEKKVQADYLKSIGCYYIQGYYYARPMPADAFEELFSGSVKEPGLARLETLKTLDNSEFWNPDSMETLIFNSYVGGACIFEFTNGKSELLRVNEQYVRELGGLIQEGAQLKDSSIVHFLDAENKEILKAAIAEAVDRGKEATREICLSELAHVEYLRVTVRLIARAAERLLFYCVIVNMTKQRVAEQKRREAEKRQLESARQLEIIMGNVNGGVSAILIDDNGKSKFVFNNDKYYELYGYTKEQAEAERLDVMTTIVPEDFPAVMEKVKKLKADREPVIIDYRCIKRDGKLAYLRANASLMDMDGYGDVITSVVTDITEGRLLEDQLRAIVDNIYGGVSATIIRSGKPEFVVVNDQFFHILGFANRAEFEAVGMDKYAGLHPDDRARIIRQFETSDGGKERYTMEYRIIRTDGELRYIRNNIRVIHLFGIDEPVQLSVANDITDLRLAQQKETQAADKLSAVLNHAGNGITAMALCKGAPELLFANNQYFKIVGYTRAEYHERTQDDLLAPIHPDDRERIRGQITEFHHGSGSLSADYRVIRRDGKTVWVRCVITITKLAGIDAPVQIGVFSDVTAEKEASDQLRFLNDSAHDILAQPDSDIAVNKTLEKLLTYFAGDRAYVIEFDSAGQVSNNTYEKCRDGVASEMERLQNVPLSVSADWLKALERNEFVVIPDANALDADRSELRALLLFQNIHSIIIAPLWRDGKLVGFAGIDNPAQAAEQLERLKALADYIAILLTRRDLNRKIEHDNRAMMLLINDTPGGFLRMEIHAGQRPAIVGTNDGLCRMLNMTRDEIMEAYGKDACQCVAAEDLASCKEILRAALAACGQFTAKCRLRRKDGASIWVMAFGRFSRDIDGKLFLNAYFTDITAQKQAENQQKVLLDNLPCGAALYEYDGSTLSVIHINKRYWQLVERAPTDYSNTSVFGVIHPDDQPIVRMEIEAAIRQNRMVAVSIRILCGKSGYRPFHITANFTREHNGNYLFYAAYTPISEQSMSVQEMIPVALSTMLSASGDFSYVKDRDLHYVCCSRSDARLLGLASEREIIGKTDYDLFEKAFAEQLIADDERILKTGEPVIDRTERIVAHDGGIRLVSASKYPILDASGNAVGLYGVSRDITAQREKESQLELLASSIPGGLAAYSITESGIRMRYFNDGFYKFSGCSREDYAKAVEQDALAFVFEEDKPKLRAMIHGFVQHKTDGHVNGCVFRCHTRDGGYRWMSLKTVLSKADDGQYTVNVVQLDITEQQEEKERLRMSEEFNRLALEQSGNIITRFDVASRTLTLPDSFNPIFVLPHVLNNMPQEQIALGRVSPDTADVYTELFEGILRGQASGSGVYKQNSTKGWRWLEAHYTTVFSDTGEPASAVISFTDVTEKLEKEVVYNKWQQSLNERAEDSYTLFRCNLSKDASFDSSEGKLLRIDLSDTTRTFDERTAEYANRYVYEEDRRSYRAFLNSDTLLAEYYRGHRSGTLEYREIYDGGSLRWLRLSCDLVEYPGSKDIEAYLMFENIDEQKRIDLLTLERAEKDPLTGILNRATFISRMEDILAASPPGAKHALFMLDVDNFKSINDLLGHGAGDQVLKDLTAQIGSILRHDDLIGRLGGDEFFVFLRDIPDRAAAAAKAKRICALKLMAENPKAATVTVSVGIAMIPHDGNDFDTLYKKVDAALYREKERGKAGYLFVTD